MCDQARTPALRAESVSGEEDISDPRDPYTYQFRRQSLARPVFVVDKIHVSNYCFCMFAEQKRSAIKDMAANLEKKWRKLLAQEVSDKMDTETAEGKPRHYVLPHTLVVDEFGTMNNR